MKQTHIKIVHVKASNLSVVWRTAQRPYYADHAEKIAENFDPDLFGVLSVTKPDEQGMHHVICGQHRLAAFKKVFGDDQSVPCIVLDAADPVRAAEIFLQDSTSAKPLKMVEQFHVAVTAGRRTQCEINDIVKKAGYRVTASQQNDCIGAVHALESVYNKHGPMILGLTLKTLQSTWGADRNAVAAPMLRGYGLFLAQYFKQVDWDKLHKCMTKNKTTPGSLITNAYHLLKLSRALVKTQPEAIALAIFETYNAARGKKLIAQASIGNNADSLAGEKKKTA
jgi:hypothetical protein